MNQAESSAADPGARFVIAIDGGAATGKTTSASRVAARLGFCYVDSGAVFRSVALALSRAGIEKASDPRIAELAPQLDLRIAPAPDRFTVVLEKREVSDLEIRTPEVSSLASKLAVHPAVRAKVAGLLRETRRHGSLVVEGRDIGTFVFPDATLKIFLTTDISIRAERRRLDLVRRGGSQPIDEVARDLTERDARDSSRKESPLRRPDDAVVIDTSQTDIDGQVEAILDAFRQKRLEAPESGA